MRIKLKKAHRHAGRDYPAGAILDLPEGKAHWLVGLGVAEPAPADAGAKGADKTKSKE
jgi:hypothetical protein